jgi:hypothetical protein
MPACPVGPADRTGAVENSLGPCRKPKSTISGWTLVAFYEFIKIKQPLYLFFFDIQPIFSYSGSFATKTAINFEPLNLRHLMFTEKDEHRTN